MIKPAEGKDRSYITVVREELQQYTQGLLRENEKLRAMATTLESDKRRLELEIIEARIVLQQKEELRRATEIFETERMETVMRLEKARHECDAANLELERLRARFDNLQLQPALVAFQRRGHGPELFVFAQKPLRVLLQLFPHDGDVRAVLPLGSLDHWATSSPRKLRTFASSSMALIGLVT